MIALTERQASVRDFIRDFARENGFPPSTREIAAHFGFASQTAAMHHLKALERKGAIERPVHYGSRTIRLVGEKSSLELIRENEALRAEVATLRQRLSPSLS